jgi:hypothetical protein
MLAGYGKHDMAHCHATRPSEIKIDAGNSGHAQKREQGA